MRWLGLWLLGVSAASCTCAPALMPTPVEPLEFAVSVDFGTAWVGQQRTQTLRVRNPARASQPIDWRSPTAPFSSTGVPEQVAGGETVELSLSYAPTAAGEHEGAARIGETVVLLRGAALAVPICEGTACTTAQFDVELGACAATPLPDDTACAAACGEAGRCVSGECRTGAVGACDDGDPCTVDACGAAGCTHVAVTCAVTDPCRVPQCRPGVGCVSEPVEDGITCGEESCLEVDICLAGDCVRRVRASLDECRYDTLAANASHACAFTRSGTLRCWGDSVRATSPANGPSGLGLPYFFAGHPPRTVATPPATRALAVMTGNTFVGLAAGGVYAVDGRPAPDAGDVFTTLSCTGTACAGRVADGSAFGWRLTQPSVSRLPGPLRDVTAQLGALETDGGFSTPLFGPHALPASAVAAVDNENRHFVLLSDGSLRHTVSYTSAALDWLADAGGTTVSYFRFSGAFEPEHVCFADPGARLRCVDATTGQQLWEGQLPEDIAALSGPCARTVTGRVFCIQRPSSQLRPTPVEDGGQLLLGNMLAWRTADGDVRVIASTAPQLASHARAPCVRSPDVGFERWCVRSMGAAPGAIAGITLPSVSTYDTGYLLLDGGTLRRWPTLGFVADDVAQLGFASLLQDGGLTGNVAGLRAVQTSAEALLLDDAGVYDPRRSKHVPIGPVERLGDARCAILTNGQVRCWDLEPDGGYRVTAPPGLRLFPREVTGTSAGGCAVTAANGVQCWGKNTYGQLGRTGPASERALDVAIGEAVQHVRNKDDAVCLETATQQIWCWGRDAWSAPEPALVEIVR